MVAQTRIFQQEEVESGFSLLKDIIDIVKNPKSIDAAYEARRKAAALTDDEVARASEARALIAQADDLRLELKNKEDSVNQEKQQYEIYAAAKTEEIQSALDALDKKAAELKEFGDKQNQTIADIAFSKKSLQNIADQNVADLNVRAAELDARELAIKDMEEKNSLEVQKLSDLENKLKAKAARLAAEASEW